MFHRNDKVLGQEPRASVQTTCHGERLMPRGHLLASCHRERSVAILAFVITSVAK
jgi:hypothetical protein